MRQEIERSLTFVYPVPRQRQRFRELVIYIADRCRHATFFGATKLNKILYYSDFRAFERFGVPVTGMAYFRLPLGPAPRALIPIRQDLLAEGAIRIEQRRAGNRFQDRVVPQRAPVLDFFTPDELALVDQVIDELWDQTAEQVTDFSHDVRWKTLQHKDRIPYEAAFMSDESVTERDLAATRELAARFGWHDL